MIKIAYTGWMWLRDYGGNPPAIRSHFEQSVKELSHLGYRYLEDYSMPFKHLNGEWKHLKSYIY